MSSILFLYWHRIDKIPEIEAKKAGNNGEGDDYGDTNFAGEEYFTKYWASALLRKYETTTDYGPSIDVA